MTEQGIRDLFAAWQTRLGLAEWIIRIDFEAIEPHTSTMQIHRSTNYNRATIKVNDWVTSGVPPDTWDGHVKGEVTDLDIEEAVVHELLHAAIGPLWIGLNLLRGESHRDAHDTAVNTYDRTEENIIDQLAVALVKSWHGRPLAVICQLDRQEVGRAFVEGPT
ncbi:MAG TPA: hypothetical protein VK756_07665 [Solirubrobacteraceae bacterium]|jgi:hypothetical protein|nr:hypothetical protein [Solirubrobacteraceae bacterium]